MDYIGFLFVILYYRGGSLLPCIITHSAINITSVFANVAGLTAEKRIIFQLVLFAITIVYSFILTKTLPRNQMINRNDKEER
ncbi:CPBP family intramembrane metalloprotease [Lachnospiraceae bacterium]|nr:CPBP family intramembrane metalloprotease [Lachnospiraceae bacterium]